MPNGMSSPGQLDSLPGGPTTTQEMPAGDKEMAMADTLIAIQILEKNLPMFGSTSDEGQSIMRALSTLTKTFGDMQANELTQTQLQNMFERLNTPAQQEVAQGMNPALMQAMPQVGGAPPELMGAMGEAEMPPELLAAL